MNTFTPKITLLLILCYLLPHFPTAEAQNLDENGKNTTTYESWLSRIMNPRFFGCRQRPWICDSDSPRVRRRCCRNRCVDVSSDVNNCGLCGVRCRFTRQCCRGICVDTNVNPFNCGRCNHRCRPPSFCSFGMCGYAQPSPPFPFPNPPRPRPHPPPFPFPNPPRPRPHPPPSPRQGGAGKHAPPVVAAA